MIGNYFFYEVMMHKIFKPFFLLLLCSFFPVFAQTILLSSKNIELSLQRFVQTPHPMGSVAQKELAQDLQKSLAKSGLKATLQEFKSLAPDPSNDKHNLKTTVGYNVVGTIKGERNCALIFGGHYDTKYFQDQYFIGANDGGSSTALLLELARVAKRTSFSQKSLGSCSLYFVLFDGEESFLPDWNDAQTRFHIQDNLYGSRAFVQKNLTKKASNTFIDGQEIKGNDKVYIDGKEIELVMILDMIGHKNQNLFITQGSSQLYATQLIRLSKVVKISQTSMRIEDDQDSFAKYNVPLLHIIDWTNLDEWHTSKDDLNIISYEKIALFGEDILRFLQQS